MVILVLRTYKTFKMSSISPAIGQYVIGDIWVFVHACVS